MSTTVFVVHLSLGLSIDVESVTVVKVEAWVGHGAF